MTVTAATQAPLSGLALNGDGDGVGWVSKNGIKPLDANDFRISMIIDRLNLHLRNHLENDSAEFFNLCLNLSRGIDVAIAHHQFPSRAQELPSVAKQVCQCQNDDFYQAAVLVLMLSVKSACQNGWFLDKDSEELQNLAKEAAEGFGSAALLTTEPNCSHSVISAVMSRFYPRIKMGRVFVFLEVKPGFDAYLSDFMIPKNLKKTSPGDKIMLFVVQTDNIATSSCLISPAKVNFLLNGKVVERRTNLFVDNGPQIPTTVTNLLKYGPNLFQAIGEFNGNYIIGIAIMSEIPNPDSNVLQDYEQDAPAIADSDSKITEGSSRISLNCPISFRRINTPVKGYLCKHIQCFDFDNYVDINSRRPSWRCSHCNQHVCFTDLRIDKKLVKILKEAEPNVSHITISPDGSWNAAMYNDDSNQNSIDEDPGDCGSPVPEKVLDLTQMDDRMDFISANETDDVKISGNIPQNQNVTPSISIEPRIANQINANVEDDYWSGVFLSSVANEQMTLSPPFFTNSFPATNGQVEDIIGNNNTLFGTTSVPALHREPSLPSILQVQQYQFGNSNLTAEYGSRIPLPRNVSRVPTAVQALPAQQPLASVLQQRCRSRVAVMQGSPATQVTASSALGVNPYQISQVSSSMQQQEYHSIQENRALPSVQPPQQIISNQVTNHVPADAPRGLNEHQRSMLLQRMSNFRMPLTTSSQPRGPTRSPMNPTMQTAIDTTRVTTSPYSTPPNHVFLTPDNSEENWRPSSRMRGALSGQAYADAFSRYITQNQLGAGGSANLPNGSAGTQ